jgi:hypothetical protein
MMIPNSRDALPERIAVVLSTNIARLVVAAILGGLIGLAKSRHKPAVLRSNLQLLGTNPRRE